MPASISQSNLVYVSDTMPGIVRKVKQDEFYYELPSGKRVDDELTLSRIGQLGLPPAYQQVWICPLENGHIQATGLDDKSRKQYRYHDQWHTLQNEKKFHQLIAFGQSLPKIRRAIERDLAQAPGSKAYALGAIVRVLDATHIRVGNTQYAKNNKSYGATTLKKDHLEFSQESVALEFSGKGGKAVELVIDDDELHDVLETIADLPGRELFTWQDDTGEVFSIRSEQVNAYLQDITGLECITAKTFRTWGGTLSAFFSAWSHLKKGDTPLIKTMTEAASEALHNTPAICRNSYIHPAVIDLSELKCEMIVATVDHFRRCKRKACMSIHEVRCLEWIKQHTEEGML